MSALVFFWKLKLPVLLEVVVSLQHYTKYFDKEEPQKEKEKAKYMPNASLIPYSYPCARKLSEKKKRKKWKQKNNFSINFIILIK